MSRVLARMANLKVRLNGDNATALEARLPHILIRYDISCGPSSSSHAGIKSHCPGQRTFWWDVKGFFLGVDDNINDEQHAIFPRSV